MLAFGAGEAQSQPSGDSGALMSEAGIALQFGSPLKALNLYDKVVALEGQALAGTSAATSFSLQERVHASQLAGSLSMRALILSDLGEYDRAIESMKSANALSKRLGSPVDTFSLAKLMHDAGRHPDAEVLFREADPQGKLPVTSFYAAQYALERNDGAAARSAVKRAVSAIDAADRSTEPTTELQRGMQRWKQPSDYAAAASLLLAVEEFDEAERCARKSVALGYTPRDAHLTDVLERRGKRDEMRRLLEQTVDQNPRAMAALRARTELMRLALVDGDLVGAKALSDAIGSEFPSASEDEPTYDVLRAQLAAKEGDEAIALDCAERIAARDSRHVQSAMLSGSDEDRRNLLSRVAYRSAVVVSVASRFAARSKRARELAVRVILSRKGIALEASSRLATLAAESKTDTVRNNIIALAKARDVLGQAAAQGLAADAPNVKDAREKASRAERELTTALAGQLGMQDVEPASVASSIPADGVLIDYFRVDAKVPAYVAVVLTRSAEAKLVELGPAAAIDAKVAALRHGIRARSKDTDAVARDLHKLLIAPLLGTNPASLMIAPDGELALIPFELLTDASGERVIDRSFVTYLVSGRELTRKSTDAPRTTSVVIVDPLLPSERPGETGPRAGLLDAMSRLPRLPGTAREGKRVHDSLGSGVMLSRGGASERALRNVHGPQVLHVATHGFFVGGSERAASENDRGLVLDSPKPYTIRDPMLASGLVLASSPTEDGVITALELGSLDLHGTSLAALSACETGLGKSLGGEGIQGLRRALSLAGAQSQLVSLWKVDDDSTAQLMTTFYADLAKGVPPARALRTAKNAVAQTRGFEAPYFWSAFILSGPNVHEPIVLRRDLAGPALGETRGDEAASTDDHRPPALPPHSGCACDAGASPGFGGTPLWLFVLSAITVQFRRRRASNERTK